MRRTVVLIVIVASALTWPPSRRWIASLLIDTGVHLDRLGDAPALTPEQRERMRRAFVDELAAALVRRGRGERAEDAPPEVRNGKAGRTVV